MFSRSVVRLLPRSRSGENRALSHPNPRQIVPATFRERVLRKNQFVSFVGDSQRPPILRLRGVRSGEGIPLLIELRISHRLARRTPNLDVALHQVISVLTYTLSSQALLLLSNERILVVQPCCSTSLLDSEPREALP